MARGYCLVWAILGLLLGATSAQADGRVALVIGNGAYQHVPGLANPVNDARDISGSLERLGFKVKILSDARYDDMRRALVSFGQQARGAELAVILFAGHGMEIGGENWLIPVDAQLASDVDTSGEAIGLQFLMRLVSNASKLGLVILDACRNNPFLPKMQRTSMTRSTERGFVRVEPTDNVLVAFAARDGTTASDGKGRNSPFTQALLKNLESPGVEVRFLFANVRDDVLAVTNRGQQPFTYGSLSREPIYLKGSPNDVALPAQSQSSDPAAQAWSATQGTANIAVLEEFIKRYGDSFYASLARARLDELSKQQEEAKKQQQAALAIPPAGPPAQPGQSGDCSGNAMTVSLSTRVPCPLSQAEERALKPKDSFKECADCPEMVVVPAGRFMMGSPNDEKGRDQGEGPRHEVTISRQLAVGKFHVTVDQFKTFVAETGYDAGSRCYTFENGENDFRNERSWRNPGFAQAGSHPAVCLNWDDAKAYVAWMAKKIAKPYRLLSEAEWEYSARAGSTTPYYFGNDGKNMCRYGNGADLRLKRDIRGAEAWTVNSCDDGYAHTSPVGIFVPNAFGLHDVHGNAWQWTEDCWHETYAGAPTEGSAWTSGNCSKRVLRGGSWGGDPPFLRSAKRIHNYTDGRYDDFGVRLGRTLTP